MSEDRPVELKFIAEQSERVLREIRSLRDNVEVVAETVRLHDNSCDRLETSMDMLRSEMREIRAELRAMHRQQQRTAAHS